MNSTHIPQASVDKTIQLNGQEIFGIVVSCVVLLGGILGIIGFFYDPKKRCKRWCKKCCGRREASSSPEAQPMADRNGDVERNGSAQVDLQCEISLQYDIVILYSEADRDAVSTFKQKLTNKILLKNGQPPKINALYDDLPLGHSIFGNLQEVLAQSTYVYIFLTKAFIGDSWAQLQRDAAFSASIADINKRWSVVPVHTKAPKGTDYETPLILQHIKGFYLSDLDNANEVAKIKKSLDAKLDLRLKREQNGRNRTGRQEHLDDRENVCPRNRQDITDYRVAIEEVEALGAVADITESTVIIEEEREEAGDDDITESTAMIEEEAGNVDVPESTAMIEEEDGDADITESTVAIEEGEASGVVADIPESTVIIEEEREEAGDDDITESTTMIEEEDGGAETLSTGPMTKEHKSKLTKNTVYLVDNILVNGTSLLEHLLANSVLTDNMYENITAEKTNSDKVRHLLKIIPKRGDEAFGIFCNALRETGQGFIAAHLKTD